MEENENLLTISGYTRLAYGYQNEDRNAIENDEEKFTFSLRNIRFILEGRRSIYLRGQNTSSYVYGIKIVYSNDTYLVVMFRKQENCLRLKEFLLNDIKTLNFQDGVNEV